MQQLVRVQKCNDDHTVLVIPVGDGSCLGDCPNCTGCNQSKIQLRKVENSINAACGQVVLLTTSKVLKLLIRASYVLPIMLLVLGLAVLQYPGGIFGFCLGLIFCLWITTKEMKAYTITGLSKRPTEKGDNDLD